MEIGEVNCVLSSLSSYHLQVNLREPLLGHIQIKIRLMSLKLTAYAWRSFWTSFSPLLHSCHKQLRGAARERISTIMIVVVVQYNYNHLQHSLGSRKWSANMPKRILHWQVFHRRSPTSHRDCYIITLYTKQNMPVKWNAEMP